MCKWLRFSLRVSVIAFGFIAFPCTAKAEAELLAEWTLDRTPNFLWGFATITNRVDRVGIHFGPTAGFDTGPGLFENAVVTVNSIGQSFVATPGTDPDFPTVAGFLTNGSPDDTVFVTTGVRGFGAAGASHPESYWATFNNSPADFSGYALTSIEMYINNVFFDSPGRDPNGDGIWTDFRIDRRFRVFGVIPEPATGLVPLIGLAGALIRPSRRESGQRYHGRGGEETAIRHQCPNLMTRNDR